MQIASNTSNAEDIKYMNLNSTCLCESENISSFCNDTELLKIIAGTNNNATIMLKKLILLDDIIFLVLVSTDFISIYSYIDAELYQVAGKFHKEILFIVTLAVKIVTLRNNMFDRIIRA